MRVDLFDFDLPTDLIANEPMTPREAAKLLHITNDGLEDKHIADLPDLLSPDDVLVFNDTKVIPARIYGKRGEANIEATLLKQLDLSTWKCLIKNARRLKIGDEIIFSDDFTAKVLQKDSDGPVTLQFNVAGADLFAALHLHGIMPLPPYIKRGKSGEETDKANYQTGFHFTKELLKQIKDMGIQEEFLTLHVGGGTFLPVKVEDTDNHKMHAEYGIITPAVAKRLNQAKEEGRRIIPVGTTALRLIESVTDENGIIHSFAEETSIFITPGYRFRFADALFTNFHTSESTLFMLVSALAGLDEMQHAYKHAIEKEYRFFSYGDACLIEKKI